MKKIVSISLIALLSLTFSFAQKIAYVNTKDIMGKMDEYNSIQDEINRTSQKWQQELEKMYQDIEEKYRDYQANEVIMPEDVRKERQDEIFKLERDAKEYREKKFGYDGELFKLQDSKVKPLQDKVLKAVETVALRKRFDLVFDKASGEATWLFTNSTFDLTPEVKKELGIEDTGATDGGTSPKTGTQPAGLALTRPNGIFTAFSLFLFFLWNENFFSKGKYSWKDALPFLAFAASVLALFWHLYNLHNVTGDYFVFSKAAAAWGRKTTFPFASLFNQGILAVQLNSVFCILYTLIAIFGLRKQPLPLQFLVWINLLLIVSTGQMISIPRYFSVLFPFSIFFAQKIGNRYWAYALLGGLQLFTYVFFLTGNPIGF